MQSKWDARFTQMAVLVSSWSKDPSTQVGAVIIDSDKRIVSTGFNGFPRGLDDADHLYKDVDFKHDIILHAEVNAILFAKRDLNNCLLYSTLMPCSRCAAVIIQSGITSVCYRSNISERYRKNFETSLAMFDQAKIRCYQFKDYYETN